DVCTQGTQTRDYVLDYGVGVSNLLDNNGNTIAYIASSVGTIGIHFVRAGKPPDEPGPETTGGAYVEVEHRDGSNDSDKTKKDAVIKTQLLNWREMPAVD